MRQDKEKTPGVFGKEVDCVDEETWFNTKSASRTQKAQSRWKGEAGGPEEYLCLLCSALRFLCSSSAHSSAYPGAYGTARVSKRLADETATCLRAVLYQRRCTKCAAASGASKQLAQHIITLATALIDRPCSSGSS